MLCNLKSIAQNPCYLLIVLYQYWGEGGPYSPAVAFTIEIFISYFQVDGQKVDLSNVTKKYHIDTVGLHYPKKGMEVSTYIKDGMIEDWDMFEQILDYSYAKVIKSESEYHPVLFSEPAVSISHQLE